MASCSRDPDADAAAVNTAGQAARMVWKESKRLWGIATPMVIAALCTYAVSSVTTVSRSARLALPASVLLSAF